MELDALRKKVIEECERCFTPRPLNMDIHRNRPDKVKDAELRKHIVEIAIKNIKEVLYKKFNDTIASISSEKNNDSENTEQSGDVLSTKDKIEKYINSTCNGYASTKFSDLFKDGSLAFKEENIRAKKATNDVDARTVRDFINSRTIPDEKTLDLFSVFLRFSGWNTFKNWIREQQRLNGDNPITPIIDIPQSKPSSVKRLEIPGATIIDEKFIEDIKTQKFSMAEFYTGLKHSQWNGIINNCDVERKDYGQLKYAVVSSFSQKRVFKIAALITGAGGSGKSVVFRRLCFDIQGFSFCKIIWIDDAVEFVQHGFSIIKKEIEVSVEQKYLIAIEDWFHIFENKPKVASEILEKLNSINNIRVVIVDRTIVGKPYEKYGADFELHLSSEENQYILDQIIKKYPSWQEASEKLFINSENYQSTLFLLLFILARIAHDKPDTDNNINLSDPLVVFRNIIRADINFIASKKLGLAKALYYWGFMYAELKTPISYKTFLRVADFFHEKNTTKISDFYKRWNADDEVLDMLKRYIYKDDEECVRFHHSIMTDDGFSKITKEEWVKFGSEIKLDLLDIIVNKGDDYSASIFLADMLKKDRNVFTDKAEKLKYIDLLLEKNNKSYYHLEMLPSFISTYAQIEKYAKILWEKELFSISFWGVVLDIYYNFKNNDKRELWVERFLSYNKIENISLRTINKCLSRSRDVVCLNNFLEKFLSGNYWIDTPYLFPPILYKLKKNSEVQNFVRSIINDVNWRDQEWYMVTSSIKICNDSDLVENFCNQLLVDENWEDTNSFIIATALIRANREIRSDFVSMILKEVEINKIGFAIVIICIQLCPNKKLQEEIVENLLKNKLWKKENPEGVIRILELDNLDNEIKQNFYKDILTNDNWREENTDIVYKSLNLLSENYEDLRVSFADKILKNKEYCLSNEYIFLLALELSKDETLKKRSANDFIANINLDSARYKYVIKDLLKLTKDQKTALYYLKEWLICDWKYEDVDDKIDNYLICFENTKELPQEIDMIIEQVSNDYLDDDKMDKYWIYIRTLYEKLMQLNLFGSLAWRKEVNKIIGNWDKGYDRCLISNVLLNHLDQPTKIKHVCYSILLNWEREKAEPAIRFMTGGFKYGTHLKIALGHPNLRDLAKKTAEEMLLFYDYEPNDLFCEPFIKIATQIVENGIYPEWEIN